MNKQPKKRGRPPKTMPDPIPDTPENVVKALVTTPPKDPQEWKFLQKDKGDSRTK